MILTASLRFTCGLGVVSSLALAACIDVDGLLFVRDDGGIGGGGGDSTSSTNSTSSSGGSGGAGQGGGTTQPTYADVVLSDVPLAYYRFEETDTAVVADASGFGHDALSVANSGSLERGVEGALSGDPGSALTLSTGAQVIFSPNTLQLGIYESYSVEAWVRVAPGSEPSAIMRWREPSAPNAGFHTFFGETSAHHKRYDVNGAFEEIQVPTTVLSGDFHHLVLTVSPPSARIYIDGTLQTDANFSSFTLSLPENDLPVLIADTPGTASMTVDELAYYPYELSLPRVEAHHRCGTGAACELAP